MRGSDQIEFKCSLTPEEIESLQKRARAHAARKGYPEFADDFAQEAVIAALRGWASTLEHLFIDLLRREQGDTRSACGRVRANAARFAVRLDAPVGEDSDGALAHELVGSPAHDAEDGRRSGRHQGLFTGRSGRLYDLAFIEELSQKEIALELGLTPGRVSQLLKPIKNQVQLASAQEELEETLERYNSDPSYSRLEVEWIRL